MTITEAGNYNRMLTVLRRIAKDYQTPDQLRRSNAKNECLDYTEELEMAYENIQGEAKEVIRGLKMTTNVFNSIARAEGGSESKEGAGKGPKS